MRIGPWGDALVVVAPSSLNEELSPPPTPVTEWGQRSREQRSKPDRRWLALFGGLLLVLGAIRTAVLLTGHVPMGHDTFQYLQLQYLVFSNAAFTGEVPLWWPLMTQGTISSVWVAISEGMISSVVTLIAPLLKGLNYLIVFQIGLLFDEGVLLLGTVLLARRCYTRMSAVAFVTITVAGSSLPVTQIWWNFHCLYLIPITLYCADRAFRDASSRYAFLTALFLAATLVGNLPYLVPITGFTFCLVALFVVVQNPTASWRAVRRLVTRARWRLAIALGIPAVLALGIGAFEIYGWTDQVVYANTGRTLSGEVVSLDEFVSYGGYLSVWKWLDLISRYNNNLDNSLYSGLLVVPFAVTAMLRVRTKLAFVFAGTSLAIALFGAATVVTVIFFYVFPLGKLFRHIGLTTPIAVLFLVFYSGFGVEWFADMLRARPRRCWRLHDLGIWIPALTLVGIAGIIGLERLHIIQAFDYSPWSNIPTRNQLVLSLGAIQAGLGVVLALAGVLTVLLVAVTLIPRRWLGAALSVLLVGHAFDVFSWKAELEFDQAPLVPKVVQDLFTPTPTPYLEYRGQSYSSSPRFQVLSPWLFDHPDQLVPTLPVSTVGAYGAQYWNNESFVHVDALASIFRADHWLRSLDSFQNAWDLERPSDRHLGFPIPSNAAYYRVTGASVPKLQVFSAIHVMPDEGAIGTALQSPSFSGDAVLTTAAAIVGKQISEKLLAPNASGEGTDDRLAQATIAVTSFSDNKLSVHVLTPPGRAAMLYYADAWHPFWHATVNGAEAPVIQANLGYKAVPLPGGNADVTFTFGAQWSTVLTRVVQLAGVLTLLAVVSLVFDLRTAAPPPPDNSVFTRTPVISRSSEFLTITGWASLFWLAPIVSFINAQLAAQDLGVRIAGPVLPILLACACLAFLQGKRRQAHYPWFGLALAVASIGNAFLLLFTSLIPQLQLSSDWPAWLVADSVIFAAAWRLRQPPRLARLLVLGLSAIGVFQVSALGLVCVHPGVCSTTSTAITATVAQLVVEGYGGFNVVRQYGQYFAISQLDGAFYYDKFRAHAYQPSFEGDTLADVETRIDEYAGLPPISHAAQLPHELGVDKEGAVYVQYRDRVFALPPDTAALDVDRFLSGGYQHVVGGASLFDVQTAVSAYRSAYLRPGDFALRDGFYPSEATDGSPFPRWSGAAASVDFFPRDAGQILLSAVIVEPQSSLKPDAPDLTMILDGVAVRRAGWRVTRIDPGRFKIDIMLDRSGRGVSLSHLLVLAPTFIPAQAEPSSSDTRALGARIEAISLTQEDQPLRFRDLPVQQPASDGSVQITPEVYVWLSPPEPGGPWPTDEGAKP